jgi:uncharacterized protein
MTGRQVADLFTAFGRLSARQPERPCQVVLFGGEPLLPTTQDIVGDILARAGEAGHRVTVVTNGTHIDRFEPLLKRHLGVVKGAQITLDGPQRVHDERRKSIDGRGSYAAVVRGVETCLAVGIGVNLRVNLDAHNVGSLDELAQLIDERGWAEGEHFQCQLAPVTDHLGTSTYRFMMREEELVAPVLDFQLRRPEFTKVLSFQLFRVLQHLISVVERPQKNAQTAPRFQYCEADRGDVVSFGPDGLMYVCPESAGDSDSAIGTYSPRYQIWSDLMEPWENRSVLTLAHCRECEIATFCGGGCAYAALRQFGTPGHAVCGEAREVVKAYMAILRGRFESGELPLARPSAATPETGG